MRNQHPDKRRETAAKARPAKARDDLGGAFAGSENKGPAADGKIDARRSSHVKNRKVIKNGKPEIEH